MKLVVDTNRIIAALIKNGASRKLLFDTRFKFFSPDYTLIEIKNHGQEIREKADITNEGLELLLAIIFGQIEIVAKSEYEKFLAEAETLISDVGDVPFLALGMALKADGIWSDDKHFQKQDRARVFKTADLLEI